MYTKGNMILIVMFVCLWTKYADKYSPMVLEASMAKARITAMTRNLAFIVEMLIYSPVIRKV